MSKIVQRLLVFAIGLPAVLSVVYFLPYRNHLIANILACCASGLGALEFSDMVAQRGYRLPKWEAAALGAAMPFGAALRVSFGFVGDWELYALSAALLWILASRVFAGRKELEAVAGRVVSALAVLLYPGAFMFWIVRINAEPHAGLLLMLFMILVFGNDSTAWAAGMLFGKGNRGLVPASPNKSAAGFIGGMIASIGVGALAELVFPAAFSAARLSAPFGGALVGFFTGAAAIIGDLAESTIKRSANIKDSGGIIPGRGGLLDSIDSLAFAAPVYLAACVVLFRV